MTLTPEEKKQIEQEAASAERLGDRTGIETAYSNWEAAKKNEYKNNQ